MDTMYWFSLSIQGTHHSSAAPHLKCMHFLPLGVFILRVSAPDSTQLGIPSPSPVSLCHVLIPLSFHIDVSRPLQLCPLQYVCIYMVYLLRSTLLEIFVLISPPQISHPLYTRKCLRMYVCMDLCMYTSRYVHMLICVYIDMHVCMYVAMYLSM